MVRIFPSVWQPFVFLGIVCSYNLFIISYWVSCLLVVDWLELFIYGGCANLVSLSGLYFHLIYKPFVTENVCILMLSVVFMFFSCDLCFLCLV